MLHFYDGQIRRYITQIIRLLSNFSVKYGDGTLVRVPVLYGDTDRQIASLLSDNSENKLTAAPRMAVYLNDLQLDRSRLSDATYVGKLHIREREYDSDTGDYTSSQGHQYTVERLMPTPYKASFKVDIWSSSTDQKLQILEQILVLFNPSLDIQTTDNYIDWTSLSTVDLTQLTFSNRSIPVGTASNIDIATLTLEAPIYISPPVKVKQLGIVTNIIASITQGVENPSLQDPQLDFGSDLFPSGSNQFANGGNLSSGGNIINVKRISLGGFGILVVNSQAQILDKHEHVTATNDSVDIPVKLGPEINWRKILDNYPGKYKAGYSKIYLKQNNFTEVVGTFSLNPLDENYITVNYDTDSFPTNTVLSSVNRPGSPGTFDAIIDPTRVGPGHGLSSSIVGTRYLIIEDMGNVANVDGADAWKGTDHSDLIAGENDIVEYNGVKWQVIFDASQSQDQLIYQTNIYTGVQYKWNGLSWVKSFEGEYRAGTWRLEI